MLSVNIYLSYIKYISCIEASARLDFGRPSRTCLIGRKRVNFASQLLKTNTDPSVHSVGDKRDERYVIPIQPCSTLKKKWNNVYILLFHDSESSRSCIKICNRQTQVYIQFFTCSIHLTFCIVLTNTFIMCYTVCFLGLLMHYILSYFQGTVEFCSHFF